MSVGGVDIDASIQFGGGRNGNFVSMDMKKALEIHDYFFHKELWIDICKTTVSNLVFKGPIKEKWGGKSVLIPFEYDSRRQLIGLLKDALDFRDMFGMCPIKVITDTEKNARSVVIPQLGTGKFLQRMNPITCNPEIIFVTHDKSSGGPINYINVQRDPNIHVFIWPNKVPDFHSSSFKTKIFKLYNTYLRLEEKRDNDADSEFNRAHPPIVTQHRKEQGSIVDMEEQEIYGEDDDDTMPISSKVTYKRNIQNAMEMENNLKELRKRDNAVTPSKKRVNQSTNRSENFKRSRLWEHTYEIKEGEEIAHHIVPDSNGNLIELQERYEEEVCLAMGVPKSYVLRKGGSSKGLKNDAINEQHVLRTTVENNRDDCNAIYQFIYNILFKDLDDDNLISDLVEVDDLEKKARLDGTSPDNNSRPADSSRPYDDKKLVEYRKLVAPEANLEDELLFLRNKKNELVHLIKEKNRVELIFEEDPFENTIDIQDLIMISDRFILSPEEEVNMFRKRLYKPPITKSDGLVGFNEKMRKYKLKELENNANNANTTNGGEKKTTEKA